MAVQSLETLSDNFCFIYNSFDQTLKHLVLYDNDVCALWKTNNEFEEKLIENEKQMDKYYQIQEDRSKESSDLNQSLDLITKTCASLHAEKETLQLSMDELVRDIDGLKGDHNSREEEITLLRQVQVRQEKNNASCFKM